MANDVAQVAYLVNSHYPFVWINTTEYMRCISQQKNILTKTFKNDIKIYTWDTVSGLSRLEGNNTIVVSKDETEDNPVRPIEIVIEQSGSRGVGRTVLFMMDYHIHIKAHTVWRSLLNLIPAMQQLCVTVVMVSPDITIPKEIERYVTVIDLPLPTARDFESLCQRITPGTPEEKIKLAAATGLGLTEFEFTNAVRLSMSELGELSSQHIHKQKEQLVRKGSGLSIYRNKYGFDRLIGMDNMKEFTVDMVKSGMGRGILILGVPGTGKSEFAKCLGCETGRITIAMDMGAMKDKYVGSTEQKTREALKIIDAMEPAILYIDELEKSLAGVGSESTDSGTSQGQGGEFLKWTNDHTSNVYLVATANDVSRLPPEYLRSGRWDAIFFVDLPNENERTELLDFYKNIFGLNDDISVVPSMIEDWTGAEIRSLCSKAQARKKPLVMNLPYVTPINQISKERVNSLREWAKNRTVPASIGDGYGKHKETVNITQPDVYQIINVAGLEVRQEEE